MESAGWAVELESRGNRAVIQGNYVGFGADGNTDARRSTYPMSASCGSASTVGGTPRTRAT